MDGIQRLTIRDFAYGGTAEVVRIGEPVLVTWGELLFGFWPDTDRIDVAKMKGHVHTLTALRQMLDYEGLEMTTMCLTDDTGRVLGLWVPIDSAYLVTGNNMSLEQSMVFFEEFFDDQLAAIYAKLSSADERAKA